MSYQSHIPQYHRHHIQVKSGNNSKCPLRGINPISHSISDTTYKLNLEITQYVLCGVLIPYSHHTSDEQYVINCQSFMPSDDSWQFGHRLVVPADIGSWSLGYIAGIVKWCYNEPLIMALCWPLYTFSNWYILNSVHCQEIAPKCASNNARDCDLFFCANSHFDI